MVVIVDYGLGNLASVKNMLKKIGVKSIVSSDKGEILNAEKLILPGVGNFFKGMEQLNQRGLIEVLNKKVLEDKIPILGICLGMQLMTNYSEEGDSKGLAWIDAETKRFAFEEQSMKIPHMGWSDAYFNKDHELNQMNNEQARFYFVHSYRVLCNNKEDVLASSNYGGEFHSGFRKNNIWGVQFHPEKSHKFGMEFLKHFFQLKN